MTPEGFVAAASPYSVATTMDRLAAAIVDRGMMVFARIDHSTAAAAVGLVMAPTQVLIFGSPRAGTPLMQSAPTLAIDLPLRILVWQDQHGNTWLGFNDPEWVARRHQLDPQFVPMLKGMASALGLLSLQAVAAQP